MVDVRLIRVVDSEGLVLFTIGVRRRGRSVRRGPIILEPDSLTGYFDRLGDCGRTRRGRRRWPAAGVETCDDQYQHETGEDGPGRRAPDHRGAPPAKHRCP